MIHPLVMSSYSELEAMAQSIFLVSFPSRTAWEEFFHSFIPGLGINYCVISTWRFFLDLPRIKPAFPGLGLSEVVMKFTQISAISTCHIEMIRVLSPLSPSDLKCVKVTLGNMRISHVEYSLSKVDPYLKLEDIWCASSPRSIRNDYMYIYI